MDGELRIRRAAPGDAEAIAEIHVAGFDLAHQDLLPADLLAARRLPVRLEQWQRRLKEPRPSDIAIVAERDGAVVGFVSGHTATAADGEPEDVGIGESMYQRPESIGGGIGHRLWAAIIDAFRELGHREMVWFVLDANSLATGFYDRQGIHPDGTRTTDDGSVERRYRLTI